MDEKDVLLIFIRNPRLGQVKTRLATTIGQAAALAVYQQLLEHTRMVTRPLSCRKIVYYSEAIDEQDEWDNAYQKKVQNGKDLGERMQRAFASAFDEGYHKAVIIGSDAYDLKTEHLEKAFTLLDTNDVVLGPATDGGYYLLGMKMPHTAVFSHKNWGTSSVLAATLNDIKTLRVSLLEPLNDIDTYEDLIQSTTFHPFAQTPLP